MNMFAFLRGAADTAPQTGLDVISDFFSDIMPNTMGQGLGAVIDILIITLMLVVVVSLFRKVHAESLGLGFGALVVICMIIGYFGSNALVATSWLISFVGASIIPVVFIVFQPEIRRLIETLIASVREKLRRNEKPIETTQKVIEDTLTDMCESLFITKPMLISMGADYIPPFKDFTIIIQPDEDKGKEYPYQTVIDAVPSKELLENLLFCDYRKGTDKVPVIFRNYRIHSAFGQLDEPLENRITEERKTGHTTFSGEQISELEVTKEIIIQSESSEDSISVLVICGTNIAVHKAVASNYRMQIARVANDINNYLGTSKKEEKDSGIFGMTFLNSDKTEGAK